MKAVDECPLKRFLVSMLQMVLPGPIVVHDHPNVYVVLFDQHGIF